jgi:hypothetical protein
MPHHAGVVDFGELAGVVRRGTDSDKRTDNRNELFPIFAEFLLVDLEFS